MMDKPKCWECEEFSDDLILLDDYNGVCPKCFEEIK